MSTRIDLLTPVGRLVQGSLYTGATTDIDNRPLVYKSGANIGQPRTNFWFNVAIAKTGEQHWSQTPWGKKIWDVGQAGFPDGRWNLPTFAWKVIDGDSTMPNSQGNRPCDSEGFPGHWVLKFSGAFAPSLFNENGTLPLTEPNAIQLGDYVEVYGYVEDNKSTQQPGIYLNHSMVARAGFGKRIIAGADPKSVGFGNAPLPQGASTTPIAQAFVAPPLVNMPAPNLPMQHNFNPVEIAQPAPYTQILTPPPLPTPQPVKTKVMTPLANGHSYESLIAAGWSDALLIQHGMMLA